MAFPTIMGTEHEYGIFVEDNRWGSGWFARRMVQEAALYFRGARRTGPLDLNRFSQEYGIPADQLERLFRSVNDIEEVLRIIGGSGDMLANGARFYVDSGHPELSTPECSNAYDLLIAEKAGERVVERSRESAARALECDIDIHKDNSDRQGSSYSAHENYLVSPELFRCLTTEPRSWETPNPSVCAWIAYLVTRNIWAGAGKVGSDVCGSLVPFQLSQRAEFFWSIWSHDTMQNRALINTRNRPYADPKKFRRLHVILGDANRCDVSIFLKMGVTALVLKMLEDGFLSGVGTWLALPVRTPVSDFVRVSYDGLRYAVKLGEKGVKTPLEIQKEVLRVLERYCETAYAPTEIESDVLKWFRHALENLEENPETLFGVLDVVTKKMQIERILAARNVSWNDALAIRLDFLYHRTQADGIYEHLYREGDIVRLADDDDIVRATENPPEDTRAWIRGALIRRFPDSFGSWSALNVRFDGLTAGIVSFDNPTRGGREEAEALLGLDTTAAEFVRRWNKATA